jgi:hypothetical protein
MASAIVRVLCLASLAASAGAADAAEPLPLYYFDRPHYVQKVARNGEVGGLTATPAAQAFRAAGLTFRWTLLPTVRQLVTLKDSLVPACAVGWFKNPERELQFKFTKPIYRDGPTVALARSDFHAVAPTLIETLRQPSLSVLVKDGFSYGPLIDGMLLLARPEKVVTSGRASERPEAGPLCGRAAGRAPLPAVQQGHAGRGHRALEQGDHRRVPLRRLDSQAAGANCAWCSRAYRPPRASNSAWRPCSTMQPWSITTMRSACSMVDMRWATISVVRPRISSGSAC